MDLNDFWQENKRFVLIVAGGVVVFFTGIVLIDNLFGSELTAQERRKAKAESTLAGALHPQSDLDLLRDENERLLAAHAVLAKASEFVARPEFAPNAGSMTSRYIEVVDATRGRLLSDAGRVGMPLPEDLGLPAVSPNKDEPIKRYLEGLDVVDRTARLCFEAGVERIETIEIKPDPKLTAGKTLEGVEKTTVKFQMRGPATALARLVWMLQRSSEARVAVLESANFISGGNREDDARLEITLAAVHLHASRPDDAAAPKKGSKKN